MTKKIDIKEVITDKDYFAFVKFPFSLYKNNPYVDSSRGSREM